MPKKGYKATNEHKTKNKEAKTKQWQNPEFRKNMTKIHKESLACQNWLRRLHKRNKGKHYSPKTEFKKGEHPSPKTEFKKNFIPWNKGKEMPRGKYSMHWKNGKTIHNGYVYIYIPQHPFHPKNKPYIKRSRLVVEKQIRRYLTSKETVHHLGIKNDDRPYMLMAFINNSVHRKFEKNPNIIKPSEIIFDGRKLKSYK